MAIESANSRFFPQVVASFGYGVHIMAPVMLGYEAGSILLLLESKDFTELEPSRIAEC